MDPITLQFQGGYYNQELRLANIDLALYNGVLNIIMANAPDIAMTINVFRAIMADPQGYAFDAIVGDNPLTIGGVPVSRSKAMGLIDMPLGWQNIITAATALSLDLSTNTLGKKMYGNDQLTDRLAVSEIDFANGALILSAAYLENLSAKYSIYTKNDNQVNAYNLLQTLFQTYTALRALGAPIGLETSFEDLGVTQTRVAGVPSVSSFNPIYIVQKIN